MDKGWGRYRWLDYRALMERYVRPPQELVGVKLFTTLRNHPVDRYRRHRLYLDALRVHSGVAAVLGKHHMRDVKCPLCDGTYKRPQEKRTDVEMATHIIDDAYNGACKTMFVVSADSDLIPALLYVRKKFGTQIVVMDPPRRHSDELVELQERPWFMNRRDLAQCQLPTPVEYRTRRNRLRTYERPPEWA
jgi:hypothetical protein